MAEYSYHYKSQHAYAYEETEYEDGYEKTVQMMSSTHLEVSYNWVVAFEVFGSDRIDYYDAKRDFRTIKEWYDLVSVPMDEEKHMRRLESNADNVSGMHKYLKEAKAKYKPVSGLTKAECLVVMMYTGHAERPFYKQYNRDSTDRNWEDYINYTRLLMSALQQLARKGANRPPSDRPLYRGIKKDRDPPAASRIFWKKFTSTTTSLETAEEFAGRDGIILRFEPPHSRHAVKIGKLSSFEEEEVLIPPFVAFDVLGRDGKGFYCFKTSKTQEFLDK